MQDVIRVDIQGDVFEVHVSGKLTHESYEEFLPALEEHIRTWGKTRLLFVMRDFHGWTPAAFWDDLRFDLKHFRDIERLAFVGEKRWQKSMAAFCKPFTPAKIRYFEATEIGTARTWLREAEIASGRPKN